MNFLLLESLLALLLILALGSVSLEQSLNLKFLLSHQIQAFEHSVQGKS